VTVAVPTAVIASVVPAKVLSCIVSRGDDGHATGGDGARCRDRSGEGEDQTRRDRDHEEQKEDVGSGSAREASSTSAGEHG